MVDSGNLEFYWKGISEHGREKFQLFLNDLPLIIRRVNISKVEQDDKLVVSSMNSDSDFLIYPRKGLVEYSFENFRGEGLEKDYWISYKPKEVIENLNQNSFKISDPAHRLYLLPEPKE